MRRNEAAERGEREEEYKNNLSDFVMSLMERNL